MASSSREMNSYTYKLKKCITGLETLSRVGQALWFRIGKPLSRDDIIWAQTVLGPDGDDVLWGALHEAGVLIEPQSTIDAVSLARLLAKLAGDSSSSVQPVWTLPEELKSNRSDKSYTEAVVSCIGHARKSVFLVSPFIENRGVGKLTDCLLSALAHSVTVTVVTHDAARLSSFTSLALEELRREATGLSGCLHAWTAIEQKGIFLHSKLIVVDERLAIVGSANVTGPGLSGNFESGVVLEGSPAIEISSMIRRLLSSPIVTHVFSTN
jgi:phosphatidylserine/phosphatidylglycerophosphate/cardiolipin synthase-like enzyme